MCVDASISSIVGDVVVCDIGVGVGGVGRGCCVDGVAVIMFGGIVVLVLLYCCVNIIHASHHTTLQRHAISH